MKNPLELLGHIKVALVGLIAAVSLLLFFFVGVFLFPEPIKDLVATKANTPLKEKQPITAPLTPVPDKPFLWQPPLLSTIPKSDEGDLIRYGKELIAHTADYLGPQGGVLQISNGMNCQNCHLDAGTKIMGNNYAAVYSTYPKFRARSGTKESITKRISDCFERSLNGRKPDSASREMRAMVAYIKWLGQGTPQGVVPDGTGLAKLAYMNRAADPMIGSHIYKTKCESCHGAGGQGIQKPDKVGYVYPPLWGKNSYNDGAGLFRVSSFAGYVIDNMPFGASHDNRLLTEEEAWDLAAFVNSRPRPHKDQKNDWVEISKKPIDFPFAPYADSFPEEQHKYGPFQPIVDARKSSK